MIEVPPPLVSHQHLPQQRGLTVPFITHQDQKSGQYCFGVNDVDRATNCLVARLCGMCGFPLKDVKVLIVAEENIEPQTTPEPALHAECAWYASRACPMLNGSQSAYASRAIDADIGLGTLLTPGRGERHVKRGAPAVAWYQLWVRGNYGVGVDSITMLPSWLIWKGMPEIRRVQLREAAG